MTSVSTSSTGSLDVAHIEQCQEVVYPWQVNLCQLTSGLFTSHMEFIETNGVLLYREFWSQGVHASGLSPAGFHMFGTGLKKPTTWCGREINSDTYAHGHTGIEMDFSTPPDSHHLVVLVPDEIFKSTFPDDEDRWHMLHEQHHVQFEGQPASSPVFSWDRMIRKYHAQTKQLDRFNTRGALQARLLDDVAALMHQDTLQTQKESPKRCYTITQNVLELIQIADEVMPVPLLAKRLGISQRVLEMALRKTLGVTPAKLMRWQRLQNAQKELLYASPDSTSVSRVALEWGFNELGRFAVEYRKLFGERPSETLRRSYAKHLPSYIDLLRKK